jgi:hypothetical protein
MPYLSLEDPQFDRSITLRQAYRIMERFASEYLARGDTAISDFLHVYAGECGGQATDPAAIYDFLKAVAAIAPPGAGDDPA